MLILTTLASALLAALVLIINAYVVIGARSQTHSTIGQASHAQTAIVLGAAVHPDGSMSAMLADRVQRGYELWKAGKVDRILVSGDHGQWEYDEPDTMRKALQARGVPAKAIFTDHAGFNTWATMVRARKVFRVKDAIVVTQGFHMARSLYLADAAGLKAQGVTSDIRPYGRQKVVSDVREVLARLKGVAQATSNSAVLLGPPVPITGDGRKSWGPKKPPAGTTG
jgi:SanA protein